MTTTRQDVGGRTEPYYEGDSLELVITVKEDGSKKDLSGASVEWALSDRPGMEERLNESDTGVTAQVTDAANGEITITIEDGVTADPGAGSYHHEVRVTDVDGDKAVVTRGQFAIDRRVNQ